MRKLLRFPRLYLSRFSPRYILTSQTVTLFLYPVPVKAKQPLPCGNGCLAFVRYSPSRRNLEPLIFEVHYHADDTPNLDFTRVMRPKAQPVGGESRRVSQAVLHPNQEKEVA